uniref:NADH-ubiquinone oxidoreductase chain 4 n=1 Tax=Darthula hardwickii TaxID=1264638 RepID=A0A0U1Z954_9HEMI|nr:NADH dehydrogenase subunit 4 [Darthula hardwickii]AJP09355.1 NADH dehydrogenase subunit 4 [Darthula hardwickii]
MMSLLMYLIFMIPICFYGLWYFKQFLISLVMFYIYTMMNGWYLMNLSYIFGLDNFSYFMILLSMYISMLMCLSSFLFKFHFGFLYLLNNLILLVSLSMLFLCYNLIVFYMFFEFTLVPLMMLILGWGYQYERFYSSLYLFFYTLFGSLPLLLYINYLNLNLYISVFFFYFDSDLSLIVHFMMILAFLIKFPLFMFHFWLPSAHVQAPLSGSMILAGLMLKVGSYGLIRFMFINENLFFNYTYIWFSISLLGSLLVSLLCLFQFDMKLLIAYSSISHMSLCLMGMLTMSYLGVLGSLLMMISHGLCSSGLFCLSNIYYSRTLSRSLYINKGMVFFMPSLSMFMFMFCCFNMGCPPSLGFFSEFMIIFSSVYYWSNCLYFLVMMIFMSSFFSFYLYMYSQHGIFLGFYSYSMVSVSEYMLIYLHLFPLVMILFLLNIYM